MRCWAVISQFIAPVFVDNIIMRKKLALLINDGNIIGNYSADKLEKRM